MYLQYGKAKGHIFRCTFDVMDKVSITLREKIADEVKPFSSDTLSKVMPEYYQTIKPYVEEINQKIANIRSNKDVGSISEEEIKKYKEIIEKLKEYYNTILHKKPGLIEYEKQIKKENQKENRKQTYILVLAGAIGAIIGGIVVLLIDKFL